MCHGGAVKVNTLPCFCCAVTTATLSSSTNDISQCCICKDYILRCWFTEEDYSASGSERCHHRPVLTPDVCDRLSFELEEGEKDLEQVTPLEGLADALVGKLCLFGCGSDLLIQCIFKIIMCLRRRLLLFSCSTITFRRIYK